MSAADDDAALPIVAIPRPSPGVRDRVARLLVELLARQALVDLGVVANNDNIPR